MVKQKKPKVSKETKANVATPITWWQWLLMYPSILVAIIGILGTVASHSPRLYEIYIAQKENVDVDQVRPGWRRQAFYAMAIKEGFECVNSHELYVKNPTNTEIDATYCPTGDIFLRLNHPVHGRKISVVFLDDHISSTNNNDTSSNISASFLNNIVPAAHAAQNVIELGLSEVEKTKKISKVDENIKTSQNLTITLCQRILSDNRTLLRKVRVGNACYDEFWDTFNGSFQRSVQVPCNSFC
jgi:hypothetical protein